MADTSDANRVVAGGGASRHAIEHHYDVGSDFYRLWLDPLMVYSCGLWVGEPDNDLSGAQIAKLDWHASEAAVEGASRVLDVGCGWGAFMKHIVGTKNVQHVTGLTLSTDQANSIGSSSPHIEVRLEDWRDHDPDEPYDAIVSIGALEHFTQPSLTSSQRIAVYRRFFDRCARWLPEGGRLSLQTIAFEDFDISSTEMSSISNFFAEDVFPESALPYLNELTIAAESSFRLIRLRSDADHYRQTLHLWLQRLQENKPAAVALTDEQTYRRYIRYMRISRALFARRTCTLYRMAFERRHMPRTGVVDSRI